MSGAEFDALVGDIRAHGLREPIVLHEGMILDGRNRYRACGAAGVEPAFEDWDQDGTAAGCKNETVSFLSAQAYVVSKNLHRRHLNDQERAFIAAELPSLKRGPVARQRSDSAKATPLSTAEAAELLNVSKFKVVDAKTVLHGGTKDEVAAVKAGDAALRTIAKQILLTRHATELRQLYDSEAKRLIERRAQGLW